MHEMQTTDTHRLARARQSLEGLSVGDAFGETFFVHPALVEGIVAERALAATPWSYTDDTMMALSIFSVLRQHGSINQAALAQSFSHYYDSSRGYGPAMHRLLDNIREGAEWQESACQLFAGQGSFGNGAAMRVAPVGAFFAEDLQAVVEHAARSAVVTHMHPEAVAGAIAVAVAAAYAWQLRCAGTWSGRSEFLDLVLPWIPESEVQSKVRQARDMASNTSVQCAVAVLGNGIRTSAQDTVPFALWCAGAHLDQYEEALWFTVSGLGDRDTTCAIVGSIVVMYTGAVGIPPTWLQAREPLPSWPSARI